MFEKMENCLFTPLLDNIYDIILLCSAFNEDVITFCNETYINFFSSVVFWWKSFVCCKK